MKKLIASVVCAAFLMQSCALVIFGPKEKINIQPGIAGATVKVNDKVVKENADTTVQISMPKKYRSPKIEVSKPGFETQSFALPRTGRSGVKTLDVIGVVAGGGLLFTSLGLALSGLRSDNDLALPAFIVGAGLFLPSLTDLFTKSPNTFLLKQVRFDMIPRVDPVAENTAATIICSSVNFKIQPGTVVGKQYYGKYSSNYAWEETANISVEELTVLANDELYKVGYPVPGLKDRFRESGTSKFQIKAEVRSINADFYKTSVYYEFADAINIKSDIVWTLYDNRKNKVVFEKLVSTSVLGNKQTIKLLLFQSVSGSIKKLMADKTFADLLKTNDDKKNTVPESASEIKIPIVAAPLKIADVINSAVTVDLGNGHGSGVIISPDGYLLTNAHVVGSEKSVGILLSNGISLTAEVIRVDHETDIALLKMPGKGFKPAALHLNEVALGTDIFAIGTPGRIDLGQSITKGIVSGKREIDGNVFLQADMSLSPGNSGGPLVNLQNQVVGIVNAKLIGKGIEGVGFAIPISVALNKLGIKITP